MKMILVTTIVSGLALTACSTDSKKNETAGQSAVSMEAKQLAAEEKAPYVAEFAFKKGSPNLSSDAKATLISLIAKARAAGKIDEIKVVTWGDSEYPSVHTKKLSKTEVDLVQKRNSNIENYIEDVTSGSSVKTISMAERPSAISEFIGSDSAEVKKSLEQAGIPTTDTSVKSPSKASKSIVIISVE
ncbi:hypothetical protein D3C87_1152630 [compost metagenome]